jgi:predicted ester cyclase
MAKDEKVLAQYRLASTPELHQEIRELYKAHSIAEDGRSIDGLLATLTDDCVYELPQLDRAWRGHAGAAQFYTELLTAFPDIVFDLTNIVIGPQGVFEEADVTATWRGAWLGAQPTGERVAFRVLILFPWDAERRRFRGERVHVDGRELMDRF